MWSRRWYNLPTCDLDVVIGCHRLWNQQQSIPENLVPQWGDMESAGGWKTKSCRQKWMNPPTTDWRFMFWLGKISQISWVLGSVELDFCQESSASFFKLRWVSWISDPSIGSNVSSSSFAVLELQMWWRFRKKTWWCSGMKGAELQTWPALDSTTCDTYHTHLFWSQIMAMGTKILDQRDSPFLGFL
jgi:hypothetical protein